MHSRRLKIPFAVFLGLYLCLHAGLAMAGNRAAYLHYLDGLLQEQHGDTQKAIDRYKTTIELDPEAAFVYRQLANLAFESGQLASALDYAKQLIEREGDTAEGEYLLGNIHWAREEFGEAKSAFERALELEPDFSRANYALGNLLGNTDPDGARGYFKKYLEQEPANPSEVYYRLSLIDQRVGEWEGAVANLEKAIEIDPRSLQARYGLAQVYEVLKDTASALTVYLDILPYDPENADLDNHVGEMYYRASESARAEEFFLKAKGLQPDNARANLGLALLAEESSDFGRAAGVLKDSAALNDDPRLSLRLSYYLTQADRLQEAVGVLEKAHAKWPEEHEISYFLGIGYDETKKPEKAVEALEAALAAKPDFRDARFYLGTIHEKQNDIKRLEKEFRALIEKNPEDAAALNFLGYSLVDRDMKLEEAKGWIEKALEIDPGNGAYMDSIGWAYFKLGEYDLALKNLKRALEKEPRDEVIWEHLGEVYTVFKDTAAAWAAWKTSLAYKSDNKKAQRKLADLEKTLSPEEIGRNLMDFLRHRRAGLEKLSGFCQVHGEIVGRPFQFSTVLTFNKPDRLTIEILGPMFVPMWKIETSSAGFEMDPMAFEGISPENLRDAVSRMMAIFRDFLNGTLLEDVPASYHKGWSRHWIKTSKALFFLTPDRADLDSIQFTGAKRYRLELKDMRDVKHRRLPSWYVIEGPGFSAQLKLEQFSADFE
ncbi:MAG: tetratricopeptide repeat protein [Elusimicrobia bacterium]|nr:tetratricopeptide repeat protein [Elusimicrobiota bacterium]